MSSVDSDPARRHVSSFDQKTWTGIHVVLSTILNGKAVVSRCYSKELLMGLPCYNVVFKCVLVDLYNEVQPTSVDLRSVYVVCLRLSLTSPGSLFLINKLCVQISPY